MPRRSEANDKSAQWLAQANQLKVRLKMAQKDRDSAIHALRGELAEKDIFEELDNEERTLARQRAEEGEILLNQLRRVKANVSGLRQMIESRGTGAEYVERLRNVMDDTENEVYVAR